MYVERDIEKELLEVQKTTSIALIGPRQAGKTTLLKNMLSKFENGVYLSFDDPDVLELFNDDIKRFCTRYLEGKTLAVLDEVQYGKDSGRKIKYLIDVAGINVWLTGSSEYVLSKETLAPLVGRVALFSLYPFSLSEMLRIRGVSYGSEKEKGRAIEEHMLFGGYPRIVLEESIEGKKTLLKSILKLILEKDVSLVLGLRPEEESEIIKVAKVLSLYSGNIVNFTNISAATQIEYKKVKKYASALEMAYLVKFVQPFFTNKLKEIVKAPKVFFIDTGIRNSLLSDFRSERPDIGALFENYVFSELIKMGFEPKYWQSKAGTEIDFIIESDGLIGIEAKYGRVERVSRGVRAFIDAYKPKKVIILSSTEKTEMVNKTEVIFTGIENLKQILKNHAQKSSNDVSP
jgi:predicted AAA+ superfamily ATPase